MTVSMALRDSPQLPEALRERIKAFARKNNFSPRSYNRKKTQRECGGKRYSHLGPLLILHNDFYHEPNPARDQTMPCAFQLLNQYGVEYSYVDISEVKRDPEIFQK